ncbi:hypothetical protein [Butyricimonas faecalis]|uniref:Uncharacterized protein n=1 Tax=Butyricimonas faecalis TaxID=2093856 RepID=A0A3Q9IQX6_9BACT|nr:hypothetical protein [Butyricimonas faecalis]AZS31638.1 hypothetical protein D8S85_20175 [Butyricimonas faecalis]
MEEKKFTEKESLELISHMIQATRKNLVKDQGNYFIIYGYTAAILSVIIYTLLRMIPTPWWWAGWFLMFLPVIILLLKGKRNSPTVVTYTDSMVNKVWQVVGTLFSLTVLVMLALSLLVGKCDFMLMLPLCLLYASIGTAITGLVIREKCLSYTPFAGFVFAIYMLMNYTINNSIDIRWNLYFGLSFVIMMIIPGHVLNNKSEKL